MSCRTGPSMRFFFWPKKQQQCRDERGKAGVGPVRYSMVRRRGEGGRSGTGTVPADVDRSGRGDTT
jgi:hypothetical protein